jgi:hypothetical protein
VTSPGYADAHRNLGNALLALDRVDDVIVEYEKALAIDPAKAAVHKDIAAAHLIMASPRCWSPPSPSDRDG